MALQASGPISLGQIRNEFGPISGPASFGAYRVNQSVGTLSNLSLDTGVPKPGEQISFSNFYSKRLNVVVDFHSIANDTTRRNARDRYNDNGVTVIGGFKSRPSSSSGTKVYINVNKRIGSDKASRNNVALRTGSWDSNTQLIAVIGSSGSLYGAGGDGGAGGGIPGNAGQGGQGSSALGIEYPTTITNQGVIFSGRGGGGGGAGGYGWTFSDTQDGCEGRQDQTLRIGGGGGAGGRGLPGGNGGARNTQTALKSSAEANLPKGGSSGTVDSNGSGGGGGSTSGGNRCNGHASSGGGGNIESGGGGGNVNYGGEGSGGQRGYAIIIGSGGSIISYTGNAASGDTVSGTVS
jgi:hypothetical protein